MALLALIAPIAVVALQMLISPNWALNTYCRLTCQRRVTSYGGITMLTGKPLALKWAPWHENLPKPKSSLQFCVVHAHTFLKSWRTLKLDFKIRSYDSLKFQLKSAMRPSFYGRLRAPMTTRSPNEDLSLVCHFQKATVISSYCIQRKGLSYNLFIHLHINFSQHWVHD